MTGKLYSTKNRLFGIEHLRNGFLYAQEDLDRFANKVISTLDRAGSENFFDADEYSRQLYRSVVGFDGNDILANLDIRLAGWSRQFDIPKSTKSEPSVYYAPLLHEFSNCVQPSLENIQVQIATLGSEVRINPTEGNIQQIRKLVQQLHDCYARFFTKSASYLKKLIKSTLNTLQADIGKHIRSFFGFMFHCLGGLSGCEEELSVSVLRNKQYFLSLLNYKNGQVTRFDDRFGWHAGFTGPYIYRRRTGTFS